MTTNPKSRRARTGSRGANAISVRHTHSSHNGRLPSGHWRVWSVGVLIHHRGTECRRRPQVHAHATHPFTVLGTRHRIHFRSLWRCSSVLSRSVLSRSSVFSSISAARARTRLTRGRPSAGVRAPPRLPSQQMALAWSRTACPTRASRSRPSS